jgi:hypothetical protein
MDWGKVYSYCERGGDPTFWAEPLNAISNGAFIIAVLIGVAVIFGAVFAIRAWWFRRKFRGGIPRDGGGYPQQPTEPGSAPKRLIEGEYTVVKEPGAEDARRQR